jgi:hypothetical protein
MTNSQPHECVVEQLVDKRTKIKTFAPGYQIPFKSSTASDNGERKQTKRGRLLPNPRGIVILHSTRLHTDGVPAALICGITKYAALKRA